MKFTRVVGCLLLTVLLSGCTGAPRGVRPVEGFDIDRYLGTWYEIARLDHSFERGLDRVTAHYSLRDDGGVKVVNRGYSAADKAWGEAEGRAYFIGQDDVAHLKVSFFGPFFGSYIVYELDHENYQFAFISGNTTSYLWLLARTPTVSGELVERFVARAEQLGFDTGELIYVEHD